jgi:hypothetical protein
MKKVFIFMLAFLAACVSTKTSKTVITPVGEWEYLITGTPEGDFKGILNIVKESDKFMAKLSANGYDLPIDNFTWNADTKKVNGELDYSGTAVLFDAVLNGDELLGDMSAGGMSFPFRATRKK